MLHMPTISLATSPCAERSVVRPDIQLGTNVQLGREVVARIDAPACIKKAGRIDAPEGTEVSPGIEVRRGMEVLVVIEVAIGIEVPVWLRGAGGYRAARRDGSTSRHRRTRRDERVGMVRSTGRDKGPGRDAAITIFLGAMKVGHNLGGVAKIGRRKKMKKRISE